MARPHRYSRSGSDGQAGIILIIILLAGAVRAHKAAIERYATITGLIAIGLVSASIIYKLLKTIRLWRQNHNPTMTIIDSMTGLDFERCVARLLKAQGYTNIRLTEQYDLGVDIVADKDSVRWGIQVKRYSGLVKAEAIRQVVTALKFYGCDQAMVITNSVFSRPACELADSNDCVLVDRQILLRWINRQDLLLGV
jgi:HJR/Mrr/RecB family endonuclease